MSKYWRNTKKMQDLIADWENIKDNLKVEFGISDAAFKTFIKPLVIKKISDENVFIIIPFDQENSIGIDYYNKKYMQMLSVAIEEYTGREYEVVFIVRKNSDAEAVSEKNEIKQEYTISADLKSEYTFENFVVGKNNEFAHSAAVAVAENPGHDYNPLFLYGGPGVGKTHLMHAIGHSILSKDPTKKVLYVTSEKFTNNLILSIKTGSQAMDSFRKKYRNLDVLLLDDIQFIQDKESTQEEFFHTFNELHTANKAIIISSDKPPKELKTLEQRLTSRFDMGMIADIKPPDYETRAAILRQSFEHNGMDVNDDVIDYIASNIRSNIRELTGATNKLKLISRNNNLTIDVVKRNIGDFINESNDRKLSMEDIINEVCSYYSVTREDINSSKRSQDIAHPRQIATYLCRTLTDNSQQMIGRAVGNRDHSTVISSISKITNEISNNSNTASEIEELKRRLTKK